MDSKEQQFEKRLQNFSLDVIGLCKKIKEDTISRPIIGQIIRSATSIGANYSEANNASSRSDFRNKIFICKKETQETKYWLKLTTSISDESAKIDELWKECNEYSLIFQKIISTMATNK